MALASVLSFPDMGWLFRLAADAVQPGCVSRDYIHERGNMNIKVTCEKHNVSMVVVREWSQHGDIEVTVKPCPECVEVWTAGLTCPTCGVERQVLLRCPKCMTLDAQKGL